MAKLEQKKTDRGKEGKQEADGKAEESEFEGDFFS